MLEDEIREFEYSGLIFELQSFDLLEDEDASGSTERAIRAIYIMRPAHPLPQIEGKLKS